MSCRRDKTTIMTRYENEKKRKNETQYYDLDGSDDMTKERI